MKNIVLLWLLMLMMSAFPALGQGSSIVYPPITSSQVASLVEDAIRADELQVDAATLNGYTANEIVRLEYAITNINVNYTNLETDVTIIASSTNNAITNTLRNVAFKTYKIKRYGVNPVTIVSTNGWYIDDTNTTSVVISQSLQALTLQNDGIRWYIIGDTK